MKFLSKPAEVFVVLIYLGHVVITSTVLSWDRSLAYIHRYVEYMSDRDVVRSALRCCFLLAVSCMSATSVHASEAPQLKTASSHPIQYYLSLPEGWTTAKKWPVVVVIESADRDFFQAATVFAQVRGRRPFILVTPLVVTNGGSGYRNVPSYHYSDAVWATIQNAGAFNFDVGGITAIV